jgi:ribosomal protein L18E
MSIRFILATVLAALAFSAEASAKNQHAGAKAYNVSDALW